MMGYRRDPLPDGILAFVGGTFSDGRWVCKHRAPRTEGGLGMLNCHCARFDDGSCVHPSIFAEFSMRRDRAAKGDRAFADRTTYSLEDHR